MTWQQSREAIRAAVVAASNLPDTSVVWQETGTDGNWIAYPRIKLAISRNTPVGLPQEVLTWNADTATVRREVWGVSLVAVSIRVESERTSEALGAFFAPGDRIPKVLRTPEIAAILTAGRVSVISVSEFGPFVAPEANRELSAAAIEAVFQVNAPVDTTPEGGAWWFNQVQITGRLPERSFTVTAPEESEDDMASFTREFPMNGNTNFKLESAWSRITTENADNATAPMGGTTAVPMFYVRNRDGMEALATTPADGLRMELNKVFGGMGPGVWPIDANGGTTLIMPLPVFDSLEVEYTYDTNLPTFVPAMPWSFAMYVRSGLIERQPMPYRPRYIMQEGVMRADFVNGGNCWEDCSEMEYGSFGLDINGTVAGGLITRHVKMTVRGSLTTIETADGTGALVERFSRLDTLTRTPISRLSFFMGLGFGGASARPDGFFARLRNFVMRVDRL